MTLTNGHAREARDTLRAMVPFTLPRMGPASDWPQRQQQEPERDTTGPAGAARKPVDGDKVIRILTAIVVLTVAAIAAVVSYSHIFALGHAHESRVGEIHGQIPVLVHQLGHARPVVRFER